VNTWKVILATLVIFGAGVVTGGLLVGYSNYLQLHRQKPVATDTPPPNPSVAIAVHTNQLPAPPPVLLRKDFLNRLNQELKLSPEQREHIEKIISEGQERNRELWQKIEPDVRAALVDAREKIRAELTPEQQTHFEEILKHWHDQRRSPPPRGHPPAGPPPRMPGSNAPPGPA